VQLQARLQAAQLQQALLPLEYLKQQNDLLSQIATAAKAAAARDVQFIVQAINVTVQGSGLSTLTDTDRSNIVNLAGHAVLDAFDAAIKTADKRSASSSLIGAGG
jgi:hypothetical protein